MDIGRGNQSSRHGHRSKKLTQTCKFINTNQEKQTIAIRIHDREVDTAILRYQPQTTPNIL